MHRYRAYGELRDVPHVVVDGSAQPGTVLVLSHWPGMPTPEPLRRDLSAEIAFAYLEHPFAGTSAMEVVRRLADNQHLLLLPGTAFGEGQERFVRLAYANVSDGVIPEVVSRLDAAAR